MLNRCHENAQTALPFMSFGNFGQVSLLPAMVPNGRTYHAEMWGLKKKGIPCRELRTGLGV